MEIAARAQQAGVTVEGGSPLHHRFDRPVDTVLGACIDSVPLMDASRAVALAHPAEVMEGLTLAMQATRAGNGLLAVPDDDPDLLKGLQRVARDYAHVQVVQVRTFHPVGTPRALARALLGVDVPADTSLGAAGVLVVDVQALYHLAGAWEGRPVTHRFVTVAGEVHRPATLRVPIGTPYADVLALCGGVVEDEAPVLLAGGPLLGKVVALEDTVDRDATALSVLPAGHPAVERATMTAGAMVQRARSVCAGCRLCTDSCPQHLAGHAIQPHLLMRAMAHGLSAIDDVVLGAGSCVGCLACEAACPAGLAPGRVYASVREHLMDRGIAQVPVGRMTSTHDAAEARRLPRGRLAKRLGVSRYDQRFPVDDNYPVVPRVLLGVEFGDPQVSVGERVDMGRLLVAPVREGVPVHASIPGVVSKVVGPSTPGDGPAAGSRSVSGMSAGSRGRGRTPNGVVEIRSM